MAVTLCRLFRALMQKTFFYYIKMSHGAGKDFLLCALPRFNKLMVGFVL